MRRHFIIFGKNFLKCGLAGWCMEILFTAMVSLRRRDMTLKGTTSLWMFPIYGCAAIFAPISRLIGRRSAWLRGFVYMGAIFATEFVTGKLLSKRRLCPWDYSKKRWNINRVVRLDFAPCWFGAGLLFEHLLSAPPFTRDIPEKL